MSPEIEATLAFVDLWRAGDPHAMAERFTVDATYRDMPIDIVHEGREAIRAYLESAFAKLQVEWIVHRIAQHDDWVLTERTDIVTMDGERFEIPVMGSMQFGDGQVRTWRDYYQFPPRLAELNRLRLERDAL